MPSTTTRGKEMDQHPLLPLQSTDERCPWPPNRQAVLFRQRLCLTTPRPVRSSYHAVRHRMQYCRRRE